MKGIKMYYLIITNTKEQKIELILSSLVKVTDIIRNLEACGEVMKYEIKSEEYKTIMGEE